MSEEILKALMELFALIVKQDKGMLTGEKEYVYAFLSRQLPVKSVDKYMQLFLENSCQVEISDNEVDETKPSARDSIRILSICNTINQTITQEQKVIVLARCFELINSEKQYTPQRMNVITTISEVFRIPPEEFNNIWQFVREEDRNGFENRSIKVFATGHQLIRGAERQESFIAVLKTDSVSLFFIRSFSGGNTLLNSNSMKDGRVYTFAPGSLVVSPPDTVFYFSDIVSMFKEEECLNKLSFVADHIDYSFSDGTKAIADFSFFADQGKTVGILGTSGSGKTTLINLLCGVLKPDSGDVRINGHSIYSDDKALDGVIGYVPQDDLLIEELTVFENLYYATAFCYGDRSRSEISGTVEQILRTLGLYDKRDLKVGSVLNKVISGGQRKRLNIALELVREPSVLFLDEPTSGLSSRDSENVMGLMHELARRGKLIIIVVHQPSSDIFKSFDQVIILDQEGEMAFSGNPIESVIHFKTLDSQVNSEAGECPACGTVNPEIIFNIIENRVIDEYGNYTDKRRISPHEWSEAFRNRYPFSEPEEESTTPYSTLRRPTVIEQLLIYLSRDIKSKLANRQYMLLTFLEAPLLGLILSYIIRYIAEPSSSRYIFSENENIPVYIFMSIIVALFLGLTISAEEIFRDRKILLRERFLNLNRGSYLFSKVLVLVMISAIQSFLFLAVANPILGIRGLFGSYWITLFVTSLCANMIGLNISSALNSVVTIYIVIPLLMIPMMVLSGAMFPFDKLNRTIGNIDKVPVIAELIPTRWTYEALLVRQATGNEYDRKIYTLKKEISVCDFNTVYRIPRLIDAVDKCLSESISDSLKADDNQLKLIRNEILWMTSVNLSGPFPATDSLAKELFTPELGVRVRRFLDKTRERLTEKGNIADNTLDRYIYDNRETLMYFYERYHNEKLEEIVRKVYEKNKILEYDNRLVQNIDPIYQDPSPSGLLGFRCHFISPVKNIFGKKIDTFVFNNLLVLFSVFILYILLHYQALQKIINFFEKERIQKR